MNLQLHAINRINNTNLQLQKTYAMENKSDTIFRERKSAHKSNNFHSLPPSAGKML